MGQSRKLPDFDAPDRVPLADLQRWLNGIKRLPGAEPARYNHQRVRDYLELLEVPLEPLTAAKGSKLFFRMSELRRQAPLLAAAFEREATSKAEVPADAEA